jgi:hypothetical protein
VPVAFTVLSILSGILSLLIVRFSPTNPVIFTSTVAFLSVGEGVGEVKVNGLTVENVKMEGRSVCEFWTSGNSVSLEKKKNVGEESIKFEIYGSQFSVLSSSSQTGGALYVSLPWSHSLTTSYLQLSSCVCARGTDVTEPESWGRGGGLDLKL